MTHHLWLNLVFVFGAIIGVRCLKNVTLEVIPEIIENGHEAILRCHYEPENTPLFTLKWYRGNYEFYRYQPNENQKMIAFEHPHIQIDQEKSNERQVVIRNVTHALTVNFSCEVTADTTFTTVKASKKLLVVTLPKGKPVIVSERDRYDPGDILKANCSSPPSKPPSRLFFTINNKPITTNKYDSQGVYNRDTTRQWIEISLLLHSSHYHNGQLSLRCIAEIAGVYSQTSEVQLGAGLREPVPERVTSENSRACCPIVAVLLGSLVSIHLLLR